MALVAVAKRTPLAGLRLFLLLGTVNPWDATPWLKVELHHRRALFRFHGGLKHTCVAPLLSASQKG